MKHSISEICRWPLRIPQKLALSKIDPAKINIIVAPTGVGKSIIASHIIHDNGGGVIITPNRALQAQYFNEIDLNNLWGKAHYYCNKFQCSSDKCEDLLGQEITRLKQEGYNDKSPAITELKNEHAEKCGYVKARSEFKAGKYGVTGVELCYFGITNGKECLVVDEAHNLIEKLTNLSGSKISSKNRLFEQSELFAKLNYDFSSKLISFRDFIKECYLLASQNLEDPENEVKTEKRTDFANRLKYIYENHQQFSYEISLDKNGIPSTEVRKLSLSKEFKKLRANFEKVYMLSATLPDIDLFCRILGIERHKVNVVEVDSPFSPENVKIFCYTQLDLGSKSYEKNIDKAVAKLDEVLNMEAQRGIIHCTSFKQINDIKMRISNENRDRLIIDDGLRPKDELLSELSNKPDGVLVSAAAHEGIDLKGDLGTFSVTFKAPFSALSPWVHAMKNRYYNFYFNMALSRFIQGLGRCIRTFDDKANIYLIDKCCGRFIRHEKIPRNIRLAAKELVDLKKAS